MKTRIIKRKGTLLSSVAMLSTAMLLTACGGDGGDSPVDDGGANPGESGAQALLYAYPDNGQGEVSTAAPVVLRFSSAVNVGEAQNSITVYEGDAQSGTVVAVTPESVAGEPNNVLLQPDEDLKPNQAYTVVIEDLRLRRGTAKDQTLTFTTRPLHEGPKSLVVKEDTFEVSRRMPDGSDMEPVMDFSSFRFQFTQPVDQATANYGEDPASTGPGGGTIPADSVVLRDSSGAPVPATLLIDGAYMTVDPEQEYLNAGETYTLDITEDLASTYGETFGAQSYTLTPKDSSPKGEPAILVQKLTQGTTSRLTGKPVNEVPVNGTLLGENKNITQASAEVVRAELADVTTYTDVTPIRLPKGTVLNGAAINPILIGGEVNAGFGSGDVTMTVLSDASGYLVPNPYAGNNPNALRIVHLLMDVGIATSEARANGAFTQDLLHIELVGLAEVDPEAGVLNLDAVSVVEPNILGQEYGYGMLSFQLQSYKDQSNPPELAEDTTPPILQSWVPGENAELQKPTDSIVLNFNEPIKRAAIREKVVVYENGSAIEAKYYVDGSAVVIEPLEPLKYSRESQSFEYKVQFNGEIKDLSGNIYNPDVLPAFELPLQVETRFELVNDRGVSTNETIPSEDRAPLVLAVYPGYPCALDPAEIDLENDDVGRCLNSFPGWSQGLEPFDIKEESDHLPLKNMASNHPIIIQFSEPVSKESIVLGQSFIVEKINLDGSVVEVVDGDLRVFPRRVTFQPFNRWQKGDIYRYTLKSNGDIGSSSATCDGTGAICDPSGFPLQTVSLPKVEILPVQPGGESNPFLPKEREWQFLTANIIEGNSGGPDMIQYFRGGDSDNSVLQVLVASPSYDANFNMEHEANIDWKNAPGINLGTPSAGFYDYRGAEERDASQQPADPHANTTFDPGGVLPPPNSAKILSKNKKGLPNAYAVNGLNIGCGYQEVREWDEQGPLPPFFTPLFGVPSECPTQKFTYLNSSLVAEVTDNFVEGKGIQVKIWPAQIMSSAIKMQAHQLFGDAFLQTDSGPQLLRMRYEADDLGIRNQPITGWIKSGPNSKLTLEASVDLYMDALDLSRRLATSDPSHGLITYPISMELKGEINFMDDGRMMIEQFNTNDIAVNISLHTGQGVKAAPSDTSSLELLIPAYGSRLQYVSDVIK